MFTESQIHPLTQLYKQNMNDIFHFAYQQSVYKTLQCQYFEQQREFEQVYV